MSDEKDARINPKILLSIVFTSYTTERVKDIFELLDSIKAQTYPNIETIFVADWSRELFRKVKEYIKLKSIPNTQVIFNQEEPGVNSSRNLGINHAKGEIIALIDDDTVLSPDWAEEMVKSYLEDGQVVGVTGPAIPLWEDPEKMSWFPKELYFVWGCTVWDWDEKREIRNVGGMNCSFKREALFKAGLYNPYIGPVRGEEKIKWFYPSGEEVELSLRVKKALNLSRIIYNPKVKIYHKVPKARFNLSFIIKRCFRFGYTKHHIEKHYRGFSNEPILRLEHEHLRYILTRSVLKFWKEFFRNPSFALKKSMLILLGTFFTGLGYFAYFLKPYSEVER